MKAAYTAALDPEYMSWKAKQTKKSGDGKTFKPKSYYVPPTPLQQRLIDITDRLAELDQRLNSWFKSPYDSENYTIPVDVDRWSREKRDWIKLRNNLEKVKPKATFMPNKNVKKRPFKMTQYYPMDYGVSHQDLYGISKKFDKNSKKKRIY